MIERKNCQTKKCPVNCKIGKWTSFSKCTKPCGSGQRFRTRTLVLPRHGGKNCPHSKETEVCNSEPCTPSPTKPPPPCPKGKNGLTCSGNGRKVYNSKIPELGASDCKKNIPSSKLNLGACSAEMANYHGGVKVKSCSANCKGVLTSWMASCKLSAMQASMQKMIKGLATVCGGDGLCKCACKAPNCKYANTESHYR